MKRHNSAGVKKCASSPNIRSTSTSSRRQPLGVSLQYSYAAAGSYTTPPQLSPLLVEDHRSDGRRPKPLPSNDPDAKEGPPRRPPPCVAGDGRALELFHFRRRSRMVASAQGAHELYRYHTGPATHIEQTSA